jgi:protein AbiQ
MDNIKLYEISPAYINYLAPAAPHLFQNKKAGQQNERKYIGVVLTINGMDYFAPLSSFKEKHHRMQEGLDFIKIKNYSVINLNNMFPVPKGVSTYVDISKERNPKYKSLLLAEYRYIKSIQEKIRKNAATLYRLKLNGPSSALTKRCNDFAALEELCKAYRGKKV